MTDPVPHRPEHPELSDEELERQGGEDPPDPVGKLPEPRPDPDPDPGWQPDPDRPDEWRAVYREASKEHRPRREDVYPFLLIRAFSPGDRGQRPVWPPTVCWESNDILLIDASWTDPFEASQLVVSPVAGRTYRVFVRVWNLGLLPAVGVHVKVWAVNAGFIGAGNQNDPYYRQHFVSGRMVSQLDDRTRPTCTALVELDQPWSIEPNEIGHYCLIASVTCPADHFDGPLLVNADRHVGQRNLSILAEQDDTKQLLYGLSQLVPDGFTLELTHGAEAALPLLQALAGGAMPVGDGRHIELLVPRRDEIRVGVDIGSSVHLLTAFSQRGRTVVARSDLLEGYLREGHDQREPPDPEHTHPFAEAGGTRRLLEDLGLDRWREVGLVTNASLADGMLEGIVRLVDRDNFSAASLASGLGGQEGAQHLLRLTLTSPRGELQGGYSMVVS